MVQPTMDVFECVIACLTDLPWSDMGRLCPALSNKMPCVLLAAAGWGYKNRMADGELGARWVRAA